ncbi:MAG TPA: helix-hairpin-helix domain-containing protein [Gemmataceae bacterium]|nr:helix-hairpin-helix domain-containing protein [Gemmataceae bacterium]
MTYLVLAVVLLAVAAGGVLYVRFRRSPARVWKGRLVAQRTALDERLRSARRTIAEIDAGPAGLRQEYLDRHLRGLTVDSLIGYPGIGPATVGRLRDEGITSIDAALKVRLEDVGGIGPSRGTELIKAIKQVRQDAVSRFEAGACPEAVAYAEESARRKAAGQQRRAAAEATARAAETALERLAERTRLAAGINFLGYLFRRPVAGLTDAVMAEPMDLPAPPPELPIAKLDPVPTPVASPPPPPAPEVTPFDRLKAAARFGYAIARADGRIAAAERKQIRAFLERRYARDPGLAGRLDPLVSQVEADVPALGDALWDVKAAIPAADWPDLYQFAAAVADAAGVRNTREIECLARVAEGLNINTTPSPVVTPAATPQVAAAATISDSEARAVLEIADHVPLSADLVRRQYRLLVDRFDPSKFAGHGTEFTSMAAEKRARVEQAARHLLAEYNEPLDVPTAPAPADPRHNPDLDAVFGV